MQLKGAADSWREILVLYRKRTGDDSFGARGVGLVRFRYSDLNEAGRVCGGCAVYVISIAGGGRMWAPTVFSVDFAVRRRGSGGEIGSRRISE